MSISLSLIRVVEDHGTVVVGIGLDEQGRTVRFGGDHRVMAGLVEALAQGEDVDVEVEGWQILSVTPAAAVVTS